MKRMQRSATRWLMLAVMWMAGCTGWNAGVKGLPANASRLGAGEGFRYTPTTEGRMFVVRGKEVVGLQALNKGEVFYSLGPAPGEDPELFKKNEYYFVPGPVKNPN